MQELLALYKEFANSFGIEGFLAQTGLLIFALFTIFKGLKFVQEGEKAKLTITEMIESGYAYSQEWFSASAEVSS